ncbi:MAG: 4Fe-4S dicluster domain-containing protein [Defluviitaleaceae bacterium]|nr:4Fe-4S dicluster domain-containing protein [Defluviitaleaceae bacterium]
MAAKAKKELPFKKQVSNNPGGTNVLSCFLCGSCTAGCPVNEIDDTYNPRKIMRMILLDKKEDVLGCPELWKCNQCHTCVSHCPQDVRFADVVRALRELAIEEGYASKSLVAEVHNLDLELRKQRLEKINQRLKEGLL